MSENFNSMYWIKKRGEYAELREASLDAQRCEPGAVAFHVNSGEVWTVAELLPGGGYLIVRSPRGTERKISRKYWLGKAWADR